jgi:hypothetical protein
MEKKTVKEIKLVEDVLSTRQICNTLNPHAYIKRFIDKKYKGQKFSLSEWKKKLKEDGLSF